MFHMRFPLESVGGGVGGGALLAGGALWANVRSAELDGARKLTYKTLPG
jgi:hypothetical protein